MNTRINLPKFDLLCSKDDLRPHLMHVFVTKEYVVATNAHIMGWANTDLVFEAGFISAIPEQGIYIHAEDWKKMNGCDNVAWKDATTIRIIKKNKRDVLIETESEDTAGGKFPQWQAVIPAEDMACDVGRFGINHKFLATMGDFLQSGCPYMAGTRMDFFGELKAPILSPISQEDLTRMEFGGLIMPMMLDK